MELFLDSDLSEFSKATQIFLRKEPLLHSMIIGMMSRYLELRRPMALLPRMLDEKGEVVALGIQTEQERALILPQLDPKVAEIFAERLAAKIDSLPGANGPVPTVDLFAKSWSSSKKQPATLLKNLRLFELNQLIPPPAPTGFARVADSKDRDFIYECLLEFHDEAVPHDPRPTKEDLEKGIDNFIRLGRYFIWEDQGVPVALVGSSRETENDKWIAPVYTPKHLRGHGYASALTAFVSHIILAAGKRGVLFTDLANPTSNSIYQKMGYKAVADFQHFGFE